MQIVRKNKQPFYIPNTRCSKKIMNAANQILKSARFRWRKLNIPPTCQSRGTKEGTIYEMAKNAETVERNLHKAAMYYAQAASVGQKIDSCIKDFASIIHQMGETQVAVKFLQESRPFYKGDLKKFDRLLMTLERQINPSGKHHCKSLLFQFPAQVQPTQEIISKLFTNTSRVKGIRVYQQLDFSQPSHQKGKWLILDFESFSAGKKTLEKFNEEQWFGINKFWLQGNLIVCIATDGRQDFEKNLVLSEQFVQKKFNMRSNWLWRQQNPECGLKEMNRYRLSLIEGSEFEEKANLDQQCD